MIDLHFSITEPEYVEAQQLFVREQNRKSRWWRWGLSVVFLLSVGSVTLTAPRPLSLGTLPPYVPALFVIPLTLLCIGPLQRLQFKKRFTKDRINLTNAHLMMDAQGYRCDVPGVGSGIAEWGGISNWIEGESVFVLRSEYLMRIVPKACLTKQQLEEVRALLMEHIGPLGVSR